MSESKKAWDWTCLLPGAIRPLDESEEIKKLRKELESKPRRVWRRHGNRTRETAQASAFDEDHTSSESDDESDDASGWFSFGSDTTASYDVGRRKQGTVHKSYTKANEVKLVLHKPNKEDTDNTIADVGQKVLLSLLDSGDKPPQRKQQQFPTYFVNLGLPQPPSMTEDEETYRDLPRPPSLVYEYQLVSREI